MNKADEFNAAMTVDPIFTGFPVPARFIGWTKHYKHIKT